MDVYDNLTITQLKEFCRDRGLSTSHRVKNDLVIRLREDDDFEYKDAFNNTGSDQTNSDKTNNDATNGTNNDGTNGTNNDGTNNDAFEQSDDER